MTAALIPSRGGCWWGTSSPRVAGALSWCGAAALEGLSWLEEKVVRAATLVSCGLASAVATRVARRSILGARACSRSLLWSSRQRWRCRRLRCSVTVSGRWKVEVARLFTVAMLTERYCLWWLQTACDMNNGSALHRGYKWFFA
jgi:hypothetical protein